MADVARLILSSGQTARILRVVPGERLYGTDDAEYTEISVIPLELNETPPEELSGKIDALACVLPDADVRGEDRLGLRQGKPIAYRVWKKNTSSAPSLIRTCSW